MGRTLKQRYDNGEVVAAPADDDIIGGIYDASLGLTRVMRADALQSYPFIAGLASGISANTAAIAALSSQGGVIQQRNGGGTVLTSTAARTALESFSTPSPVIPVANGDRIIHEWQINVLNNTGSPADFILTEVIHGTDMFACTINIAAAASSVAMIFGFVEYIVGSTTSTHSQRAFIRNTGMTAGSLTVPTGFVTIAQEQVRAYTSTATDFGGNFPSLSIDMKHASASASLSSQRQATSITLIRAS